MSKVLRDRLRMGFTAYGTRIFFPLALILVAILGFQLGYIHTKSTIQSPLVFTPPSPMNCETELKNNSYSLVSSGEKTLDRALTAISQTSASHEKNTDCLFVGSRASDKFHSPTCSWAKRIKPANIVCFHSREEAEKRGYTQGCIQ